MSNGFDMFDVDTSEKSVKKEKRNYLLLKIGMKIVISIWLAFFITYLILFFVIDESRFLLYFAGAITGAFWGSIWNMLLFYRPSPLRKSSALMRYYLIALILLIIFTMLVLIYFPIKKL
jgi:hypothetical protein